MCSREARLAYSRHSSRVSGERDGVRAQPSLPETTRMAYGGGLTAETEAGAA